MGDRTAPPRTSKESPAIPDAWQKFRKDVAKAAAALEAAGTTSHRRLDRLHERLKAVSAQLQEPPVAPRVPKGLPEDVAKRLQAAITGLQGAQKALLEDVALGVEDFAHAMENEDRFVVLVFGEVNSGKTGLANHIAGMDFGAVPPELASECFIGADAIPGRLAESPVECTREYQGFRSPGLLWVDCPGVLSTTSANAEMARRLVARADFIVFASNSDAPFKRSEMEELKRLIQESGSDGLEGVLVITRADRIEEDVDDAGNLVKRVERKAEHDLLEQVKWAKERLADSGLTRLVKLEKPVTISVYVARDALGCRWKTGEQVRTPAAGWPAAYETSGLPMLLGAIGNVIRRDGAKLKALWPEKRAKVLKQAALARLEPSAERLGKLAQSIAEERSRLQAVRTEAQDLAGEAAAARVAPCLGGNGVFRTGDFKPRVAERELKEHLAKAVQQAVSRSLGKGLEKATERIGKEIDGFIQEARFDLQVREKYRTRTYSSGTKGRGYGSAVGGAGGGIAGVWAGAAAGSVFGPVGTVIGGLLGGFFGGVAGGWGGGKVGEEFQEKVTVKVPAGTNGDEVVAETQKAMKKLARKAARDMVDGIDESVFVPLEEAVRGLQTKVMEWKAACSAPRAQARLRTTVRRR